MSAVELAIEKVKALPEAKARVLLDWLAGLDRPNKPASAKGMHGRAGGGAQIPRAGADHGRVDEDSARGRAIMAWVVDPCLLIDLAIDDPQFFPASARLLDGKQADGLAVCPISVVELAPVFAGHLATVEEFLENPPAAD